MKSTVFFELNDPPLQEFRQGQLVGPNAAFDERVAQTQLKQLIANYLGVPPDAIEIEVTISHENTSARVFQYESQRDR